MDLLRCTFRLNGKTMERFHALALDFFSIFR